MSSRHFTVLKSTKEPSWCLLAALRLCHLGWPTLADHEVQPWFNMVDGTIDQISSTNESQVQTTLQQLLAASSTTSRQNAKIFEDSFSSLPQHQQSALACLAGFTRTLFQD